MGLNPEDAKRYREETEKTKSALDGNFERLLDLAGAQRDVLFFSRDYATEVKKASKALDINAITASETAKAFEDVAKTAKKITDSYGDVISGEKKLGEIQQSRLKLADATNSLQTEYEQFLQSTLGDEGAINDVLEGRVQLEDALVDSAERGVISEDDLQAALDLGNIFAGINAELEAERANMDEIERRAGNIEDALNFGGGVGLEDAASAFEGIVGKLGGGDFASKLGIGDAVNESRKFAAKLTESGDKAAGLGGKFEVAKNLAGNIGKNLTKSLGPAALLAAAVDMLVSAFMELDKMSGDLAKEFGVSAEEAQNLVAAANDAAGASGDILVSTQDVVAAQQALNKEFGTAVEFSGEFAAEFASVQERTKLSAEAMGLFATQAQITGTSIKDQLSDVTAVTMELNNQNGIALNVKDIQEGLAKTSKAALLTAGRNTKELANQVYQSKLLGVEQSKVEGIADNLLDFEGSIAKELEAELLIGKDLNLERARAAALEGDLATVAKEVKEQVGSAAEFTEMNVIQQKALAESVGMTREELAEALVNQEQLEAVQKAFGNGIKSISEAQEKYNQLREGGLSAEEAAAKLGDEALAKQLESASVAEKFQGVQDKIKDLFMQIATALMPVVNILTDILENILGPILQALNPILDVFSTILGAVLKPIAKILSGMIKPVLDLILTPVQQLMDAFSGIKEQLGDIFGEAEGGVDIFETIGEVLGVAATLFLTPLKAALSFINIITEQLQGFGDIFAGIAKLIEGDFAGAINSIGIGLIRIILAPIQAGIDIILGTVNSIIGIANKFGAGLDEIEGFNITDNIAGALGIEDTSSSGSESESNDEASETAERGPIGLATGGIVTSPTNAIIGEGGEPEAVIPLSKASSIGFGGNEKTIQLLERLVAAVEKGGIVELDGNKVGTALGLSSYKTQ